MGTRGVYGFYKDGVTKSTYNHFDSYPSYLGVNIAKFIKETSDKEMNKIFDQIQMIDGDSQPSPKQWDEYKTYYDPHVDNGRSWYSLLRESQGNLDTYKNGLKYMIDSQDFIEDSLFCEWGYIINLNTRCLEIYRGFQKTTSPSRYALSDPVDGYWHCRLIDQINFDVLKKRNIKEIMGAIEKQLA